MQQFEQRTLERGSEGPDVEELQRTLVEQQFKPGEIDGVFGVLTESALKMFQTAANIAPDGIVGPKTWEKLATGDPALAHATPGSRQESACAAKLYES